jgi:hypothetical protein
MTHVWQHGKYDIKLNKIFICQLWNYMFLCHVVLFINIICFSLKYLLKYNCIIYALHISICYDLQVCGKSCCVAMHKCYLRKRLPEKHILKCIWKESVYKLFYLKIIKLCCKLLKEYICCSSSRLLCATTTPHRVYVRYKKSCIKIVTINPLPHMAWRSTKIC